MTSDELSGKDWCSFQTKTGKAWLCFLSPNSEETFDIVLIVPGLPLNCQDELTEYKIVHEVIDANASVLEIGGRLGTVSCEIAKIQGNSGKLVAVSYTHLTLPTTPYV